MIKFLIKKNNFTPLVAQCFPSGAWTKWVLFGIQNFNPNYRQIFPNEIVLETDFPERETNEKIACHVCQILRNKKISFSSWFSGNKSVHIHIWFDRKLADLPDSHRTRAKKEWVRVVFEETLARDFDTSNFGPKTLIGLENEPHRKTRILKKEIDRADFGKNIFPIEIIKKTKKEPRTEWNDEKDISSGRVLNCFVCAYSIKNKISEGERNNILLPNFLALSPTRKQIKSLAETQNMSTAQIDGWKQSASFKGAFNCTQLSHFAQKNGLEELCRFCTRGVF